MAAPTAAAPQRVCPHCATVAFTAGRRCPYCKRSYTRHVLAGVAAMLLVTAAVVLGGMYVLLLEFGNTLDSELDRQVRTVQGDLDSSIRGLERDLRRELDRRLPAAPAAP